MSTVRSFFYQKVTDGLSRSIVAYGISSIAKSFAYFFNFYLIFLSFSSSTFIKNPWKKPRKTKNINLNQSKLIPIHHQSLIHSIFVLQTNSLFFKPIIMRTLSLQPHVILFTPLIINYPNLKLYTQQQMSGFETSTNLNRKTRQTKECSFNGVQHYLNLLMMRNTFLK